MSNKTEIIHKKDQLPEFQACRPSIKDLFVGLKYQVIAQILLRLTKKLKCNLNSTTQTVIYYKFNLDKSFQEILYRNENLSNEESGWIIEPINFQYINVLIFRPLSESSYIKIPYKLRNPNQKD